MKKEVCIECLFIFEDLRFKKDQKNLNLTLTEDMTYEKGGVYS